LCLFISSAAGQIPKSRPGPFWSSSWLPLLTCYEFSVLLSWFGSHRLPPVFSSQPTRVDFSFHLSEATFLLVSTMLQTSLPCVFSPLDFGLGFFQLAFGQPPPVLGSSSSLRCSRFLEQVLSAVVVPHSRGCLTRFRCSILASVGGYWVCT
jgi:hypothetical protein